MKIIVSAAAVMAVAGCAGVPVTRTAANDDACLRKSVSRPYEEPRLNEAKPEPTNCESMISTWGGRNSDKNRGNEPAMGSSGL